jgi:hypothetical protein
MTTFGDALLPKFKKKNAKITQDLHQGRPPAFLRLSRVIEPSAWPSSFPGRRFIYVKWLV